MKENVSIPNSSPMHIVFMGSDALACPALERLLSTPACRVQAVLTQPDRRQGRRLKSAACPAKQLAAERGVEVWTPEKIGDPEVVERLQALQPDLFVVAAYGQYIPASILSIPTRGSINIHPSLLPKYRGASPIQWAVADGLTETGVTILYVGQEMDAGDILLQQTHAIDPEDTAETLKPRLAELGARLLLDVVERLARGECTAQPQDEARATYVKKLTKEDGRMDWTLPATTLRNRIRAFTPWPSCYAYCPGDSGMRIKILSVRVEDGAGEPGHVLALGPAGPLVATGEGAVRLLEVQPEGKKRMPAPAFLCGYPVQVGDRFG